MSPRDEQHRSGDDSAGPTWSEWNDPRVVSVNKLAPRMTARSFPSLAAAERANIALTLDGSVPDRETDRCRSLDGAWRFRWVPRPQDVPVGHYQVDADDSDWDTISVPSVWELQGYGNLIYAPAHLPPALRGGQPPSIDVDHAPVGCYRRTFDVPPDWQNLRVSVLFGGVSSAMYLWVNGTYIGYSQVSRSPAEFDISDALRPGTNQISVQVHRWCDGSYLENQDMWFLSGIFRSVELRAEPPVRLDDVVLSTLPDDEPERLDTAAAILRVGATVASGHVGDPADGARDAGWQVGVSIRHAGDELAAGACTLDDLAGNPTTVELDVAVTAARWWTAETPNLYDVYVSLADPDGTVVDVRRFRHGFRTVEIRDGQLLVNGAAVLLTGVNRHDMDAVTGSTISEARLREDVSLIKAANINAVRTSHYPDDERFYDLCDEVGIYVMDEADLESHAVRRHVPGSDPRWTAACVDRAERLVRRDRNRACVIIWSLGNEAGMGTNHAAMAEVIRSIDPGRPIHYEGDHQVQVADMWSAMYAPPGHLRRGAEGRSIPLGRVALAEQIWQGASVPVERLANLPLVLCEYAHCMGNSLGNIEEYLELFRGHPQCIGGFIWDFADQGLRHELPDGTVMWARGGDLTDELNFGAFCGNGIVAADRTPHPAYFQVAAVYADVDVHLDGPSGEGLLVENRFNFRTLEGSELRWRWAADGTPVSDWVTVQLSAGPGDSERVDVGAPPTVDDGSELLVETEVRDTVPTSWAPGGHVLARVNLEVAPRPAPASVRRRVSPPNGKPVLEISDRGRFRVASEHVTYEVNRSTGELDSICVDGTELLVSGIAPNLWRAQIDNEIGAAAVSKRTRDLDLNPWRMLWSRRRCTHTSASVLANGDVQILSRWRVPGGRRPFAVVWTIDATATLRVDATFTPMLDLPRMGVTFETSPGLDRLTWFGRGPHETMWDRKSGAPVGRYSLPVAELTHEYLRPQENGNRTDVRWAELTASEKSSVPGLLIADASGEFFEMTARPYRQTDLADATHGHLVGRRDTTTVTIDVHQRGAGGETPAGVSTFGTKRRFQLRPFVEQRLSCTIAPLVGS